MCLPCNVHSFQRENRSSHLKWSVRLDVKQWTTPYHAMGNGTVENFNKTTKNLLKKDAAEKQKTNNVCCHRPANKYAWQPKWCAYMFSIEPYGFQWPWTTLKVISTVLNLSESNLAFGCSCMIISMYWVLCLVIATRKPSWHKGKRATACMKAPSKEICNK